MKRDERWDGEDGVLTISSPMIKCSRMLLPSRKIWGHVDGLSAGRMTCSWTSNILSIFERANDLLCRRLNEQHVPDGGYSHLNYDRSTVVCPAGVHMPVGMDCLTKSICKINEHSEVAQCTRLSAVSTVTVRIRAANSMCDF
jgi:hypothetical protein